jgi:hypothetical protein
MNTRISTALRITLPALFMGLALTSHAQQPDKGRMQKAMQELDARFATADANKDGCVTKEEAGTNMPRVQKNFDAVDTEKKSCVTLAQIKTSAQEGFAQRKK